LVAKYLLIIVFQFINELKTNKREASWKVARKTQELKHAVLQELCEVLANLWKEWGLIRLLCQNQPHIAWAYRTHQIDKQFYGRAQQVCCKQAWRLKNQGTHGLCQKESSWCLRKNHPADPRFEQTQRRKSAIE